MLVDAGEGAAGVRGGQFVAHLRALRRLPGGEWWWERDPSILSMKQQELEAGNSLPASGHYWLGGTVVDQGIRTLSE